MQATIEAVFLGYVRNIQASTKKIIAYKKKRVQHFLTLFVLWGAHYASPVGVLIIV